MNRRRNKEYLPDSRYIVAIIREHDIIHSATLKEEALKKMSYDDFRYATKKLKEQKLLVERPDLLEMRSKYYRLVDDRELASVMINHSEVINEDIRLILA